MAEEVERVVDRSSRHGIELTGHTVIKRFASWRRGEHENEWRALRLIAEYAPGLAPEPIRARLDTDPPCVVMSRLPGTPLRGNSLTPTQITALAEAIATLHTAIPARVLDTVPVRPWHHGAAVAQIHAWCAMESVPTSTPVTKARDAGLRWLRSANFDTPRSAVFGSGDGNLSNYLWDGARVRIVDFEDSGRSDRAYELAEIAEHVSAWVDTDFDAESFLARFDLRPAEAARLRDCRRLISLVWLFLLSFDNSNPPRNPPGTAERQAERLMALLC